MANEVRTFTLNDDPGQVIEDLNAAFDGTTQTALKAGDVKDSINGVALSEIFESDKKTVKEATHATSADNAINGVPVGTLFPYAGPSVPTGYLLCYGQAVSRTTYSALFAVIGTTYGAGDGSTTFNIPDLRGRVLIGLDNMGGTSANVVRDNNADIIGGTGGEEKHTQTIGELVSHSHAPITLYGSNSDNGDPGSYVVTAATEGNGTHTISSSKTGNTGGGQPFNIMQPWVACNYIIRY